MRKRRIIAFLLTLCLAISLLPAGALAAEADRFTDVSADAWYYEDVSFVVRNGYFIGVSDTEFAPGGTMTRAMLATVLARYAGAKVDDTRSTFSDVPVNTWYTGSVTWAHDNGIVEGYGGGMFGPSNPITRQELATMVCRFIKWYEGAKNAEHYKGNDAKGFKDDAAIADWAKDDVKSCQTYGLFKGDENGNFLPASSSTRAQIAAVIHRLNWLKGGPIDKKDYKITLYSEGKVYASATVKGGDTYTIPKDPTRSGYSFKGWALTENGTVDKAYKAGSEITVAGDLTLYAVWQSTGGGGGGGGSVTPPTPAEKTSTLTLDANYEGGTDRTVTAKEKEEYKYTLTEADKPAARANYYFAGWSDAEDSMEVKYNVGTQVDVTENGKTIYAVWIEDYVGKAVENTWSWAQTDVQNKLNSALGKLSQFINTKLDTDPNVETDFADELSVAINYPEKASMEQEGRKIEVTVTAETNSPSVLAVSEFVIRYAAGMLGDTPAHTTADVKEMVKDMIKDVVAELGYTPDYTSGINAALDKLADELAADYSEGFKDNWKVIGGEKGQGASAISHMKATCGDAVITDVDIPGVTMQNVKDAAKNAALEIGKGLRDSAANYTTWSGDLTLNASVKVEFTPADSIKAAYKSEENTGEEYFPTEYTIDFKVNFQSDYLQYKHEADEHYVKVILPEKVQTAYDEKVGAKLGGLLKDPEVTAKLDEVIEGAKSQITEKLNEKITELGDFGLGDIGTTLNQNLGIWLQANNLSGANFTESYIYKRLNGTDPTAQPKSTTGLESIVNTAATGVQTVINNKLTDVPGKEYSFTYSGQTLTLDLGIDAKKTITDAIKNATPGQLGTALDNAITSLESQIDALTADSLQTAWNAAVDKLSIEEPAKTAAKQALSTQLGNIKEGARGKLTEVKKLVEQLKELEGNENTTIQAVIKYLEAYISNAFGNYNLDTDTPKSEMYAAIADYVYEQVAGYSDLVQLFEKMQTIDGAWDAKLSDLTSQLSNKDVKSILTGQLTAEDWNTAAGYVGKAADALGKVNLGQLSVGVNNGTQITLSALTADLKTLQEKLTAVGTAKSSSGDTDSAYTAAVTQLTTILSKYGLSDLSLSSFDESSSGVKISAMYGEHTISFHLVLEKGWE